MADEFDYTKMWAGSFELPPGPDDGRGLYLDEGRCYDESTRRPYADDISDWRAPHPGPAARRAEPMTARCAHPSACAYPSTPEARYAQGSRDLGHPGNRGMVTSARGNRGAIEDVAERAGEWSQARPFPRRQDVVPPPYDARPLGGLESFVGGVYGGGASTADTLKIILIVILFVLLAMVLARNTRAAPRAFILVPQPAGMAGMAGMAAMPAGMPAMAAGPAGMPAMAGPAAMASPAAMVQTI